MQTSNTPTASSISLGLIPSRPVHHLFITIREHGIYSWFLGKRSDVVVANVPWVSAKKQPFRKKNKNGPYLFTSATKWKDNRKTTCPAWKSQELSTPIFILCSRLWYLMIYLTWVPPPWSKLLCLKSLPICDERSPAKITSYLEFGKIHWKYVIFMLAQSVHSTSSLYSHTKALILFSFRQPLIYKPAIFLLFLYEKDQNSKIKCK